MGPGGSLGAKAKAWTSSASLTCVSFLPQCPLVLPVSQFGGRWPGHVQDGHRAEPALGHAGQGKVIIRSHHSVALWTDRITSLRRSYCFSLAVMTLLLSKGALGRRVILSFCHPYTLFCPLRFVIGVKRLLFERSRLERLGSQWAPRGLPETLSSSCYRQAPLLPSSLSLAAL